MQRVRPRGRAGVALLVALAWCATGTATADSSFYQETRARLKQQSRPADTSRSGLSAQIERVDRARLERSQLNRAADHDARRQAAGRSRLPGRRAYLRQVFRAEVRSLESRSRPGRR